MTARLTVSLLLILASLSAASSPTLEPASPESQGVDSKKLQAALDYLESQAPRDGVRQTVILRNGRTIRAGPEASERHGVWSCTKSFTSTVLGLLIDDGKCTLNTLAADIAPAMAEAYPEVTLRHFTTMTSGYRAVGDEPRNGYSHGPSLTPFQPHPEPLFAPGKKYAYWDSAMNQFANLLTKIAGEKIEDYFRQRIADPIGMDPDGWDWGELKVADGPNVNGGSGNSGGHVFITAREMARFGQLFLDGGRWGETRLISRAWVERATRTQVSAAMPQGHLESGIEGPGMYGFNWWTNGLKPNGKRKWQGVPTDAFAASGHNNNDLFIVPSWNIVAVRLGLDQSGGFAISDEVYAEFLRRLGAALQ